MMHRVSKDSSGVAAVEFAILAPTIALLMIGMVNLSMGFDRKLQLEQAANRAIEKVMQTTQYTTVTGTLEAEAAAGANVPITNAKADNWLECDGVRQAVYNTLCPAGQRYSRYISVSVKDDYHPIFTSSVAGPNPDGSFTLTGVAGIRTE